MIFSESISSRACLSAINIENQWIIELIPNFTLNNVELGILLD